MKAFFLSLAFALPLCAGDGAPASHREPAGNGQGPIRERLRRCEGPGAAGKREKRADAPRMTDEERAARRAERQAARHHQPGDAERGRRHDRDSESGAPDREQQP